MKAKEMFEELGYVQIFEKQQIFSENKVTYQTEKDKNNWFYEVCFMMDEETYAVNRVNLIKDDYYGHFINFKLNKAIQQQIKDLGWEE